MVKLYKKGAEDKEITSIIENQIRVPQKTLGDIRAQVSMWAWIASRSSWINTGGMWSRRRAGCCWTIPSAVSERD